MDAWDQVRESEARILEGLTRIVNPWEIEPELGDHGRRQAVILSAAKDLFVVSRRDNQ